MSWTSEASPAPVTLRGGNLVVILAASLVVAVSVPLLGNELLRHLIFRVGPTGIDIRNLFFLTGAMTTVGVATAVFAAVATRLPFVGVGVALVASTVVLEVERWRGGLVLHGVVDAFVWLVIGALCLLGVDLLVLARRGLTFGIGWALAGALSVAALGIVETLVDLQVHGAPVQLVLQDWRLDARMFVESPAIIVLGGLLGRLVHRVLSPLPGPMLVGG